MRLLVDANLSPKLSAALRAAGHDAIHVSDVGLLTADDETILTHAAASGQVIISADADFAWLLAVAGRAEPSLVLLRSADHLTPQQQAGLLVANIEAVTEELQAGAVVTIGRGHMRVRVLPVRRD